MRKTFCYATLAILWVTLWAYLCVLFASNQYVCVRHNFITDECVESIFLVTSEIGWRVSFIVLMTSLVALAFMFVRKLLSMQKEMCARPGSDD